MSCSKWLLTIESSPAGDDRLQQQITLSNQLLLRLKTQIQDDDFIEDNLLVSRCICNCQYTKIV
ncbi:hypothetical protein RS130_04715 [Paraglaciecola aquimarina]|uniref:Uncharacterized protein n=1 Tax=Paraglaciecola aquimarina TaxID=1235557 RepID=A0ABU3STI7_9ALTE|nr:hypothetical protein [Paraglaciecola aquimarina]MDU0353325.1 hypothetical protein [Paraglaciecola aquimarina]